MSVEKIIQQIKKDSEEEVKKIINEAKQQAKDIIEKAKEEAKIEANKIVLEGKRKGENLKKMMVAKATQEERKEFTKMKEEIIEKCFADAYSNLASLKGKEYQNILRGMIEEGKKRLGKDCKVILARESDKKFVEEMGLNIIGKINASGGVVLRSNDGEITIDYTFESLLKRNKDKLRIEVGKILFS